MWVAECGYEWIGRGSLHICLAAAIDYYRLTGIALHVYLSEDAGPLEQQEEIVRVAGFEPYEEAQAEPG